MKHYRPRYALQQLKRDDPLVQQLVKLLRKANRVAPALQENLSDKTTQEANYLKQTAAETVEAYAFDWEWYSTTIGDLAEISNNLQDLDEQAEHWIEFLDDLYNEAVELELQADQANYPEDHLVFQFVDKIEELLNLRMD